MSTAAQFDKHELIYLGGYIMTQFSIDGFIYYVVSGVVYTNREDALEALQDERNT